jgi:hypothetical protein
MLLKSKVQETIDLLEDEFSIDELIEKLYLIEKIEKGLEQGRNGKMKTEEELDKIVEGWFA